MEFTHFDEKGRPRMVDVGDKPPSHRTARAEGRIGLQPETVCRIRENQIGKGNVLITAELAGVQAAKQTALLIPLCHTLSLSKVCVEAVLETDSVRVTAEIKCTGQTGCEMEALTAVSVALLTVYDMCKAVDKTMELGSIRLLAKQKVACG
ncbi:MAG: cyclic pyranopterin monophosphate synthase MoaC [bacterium]